MTTLLGKYEGCSECPASLVSDGIIPLGRVRNNLADVSNIFGRMKEASLDEKKLIIDLTRQFIVWKTSQKLKVKWYKNSQWHRNAEAGRGDIAK